MKITIIVKESKKVASYCGGGCNGCSCSHCKGGIVPSKKKK